jgi:RIP metalloprotease RseP
MDVFLRIIQVVFALSILVLVHEFGHFFFARLFKIRVEKFYLFFNPWFSLFKFKPKNSDTEYGIGWVPLGGYCKISGMIDESMDKEALKGEPQPWEFRSRPTWQRFLVMFGGVFFNFILAILIYAGSLFTWGDSYLKNSDAIYGVNCSDLALEIGFQNGDKILYLDGDAIDDFSDIHATMIRDQVGLVTVLRNDQMIDIDISPDYISAILNSLMFEPRIPSVVSFVIDSSLNKGVLLTGDQIVAIDSSRIFAEQDIREIVERNSGNTIMATILRNGEEITTDLIVDNNGKLGIFFEVSYSKFLNITTHNYSLLASIPAGFNKAVSRISNYLKELKLIFSPKTEAYKSVGSFITIGRIFPATWSWEIFWDITALLSIMLAIINLLPIPALDGGHILFLIFEMVTGRKPGDKFMEYATLVGLLILFAIMFFALGNDILRLFK